MEEKRKQRLFLVIAGILLLAIVAAAVILVSVHYSRAYRNWYSNETPWDYRPSVWICEDPYLVLTVSEDGNAVCTSGRGAEACSFIVDCRGNNIIFIEQTEDGQYGAEFAQGGGDFSAKTFKVTFNEGVLFPGMSGEPVFKLVFTRQETDYNVLK